MWSIMDHGLLELKIYCYKVLQFSNLQFSPQEILIVSFFPHLPSPLYVSLCFTKSFSPQMRTTEVQFLAHHLHCWRMYRQQSLVKKIEKERRNEFYFSRYFICEMHYFCVWPRIMFFILFSFRWGGLIFLFPLTTHSKYPASISLEVYYTYFYNNRHCI